MFNLGLLLIGLTVIWTVTMVGKEEVRMHTKNKKDLKDFYYPVRSSFISLM